MDINKKLKFAKNSTDNFISVWISELSDKSF